MKEYETINNLNHRMFSNVFIVFNSNTVVYDYLTQHVFRFNDASKMKCILPTSLCLREETSLVDSTLSDIL